jgi:HK97 gp10 family phage protein
MMEFDSLAGLAAHLTSEVLPGLTREVNHALERVAESIEETAKAEIGVYQDAAGAFAAWQPLADSTVADRVSKGFTPDDPLLRTEELQESIVHEVGDWEATVGSVDPVVEFHEFGTSKMPPRPVLGPALLHNAEHVQKLIGDAAVSVFVGGDAVSNSDYTLEGSAD